MTMVNGSKPAVRVIASNLHVGGGVQAAASLIDEMVRAQKEMPSLDAIAITYEVSPEVWRNLRSQTREGGRIDVRRRRPTTLRYLPSDLARRYSVALVVFGPVYFPLRTARKIMGYADVTSVYDEVPGLPRPRGGRSYLATARRRWSLKNARRSSLLVVETEAMRQRVEQKLGSGGRGQVRVIPNVVNVRVLEGSARPAITLPRIDPAEKLLLYTTRAYAHKNLQFLPALRREAHARHGLRLRFLVTLTEHEWSAQPEDFRHACVNLGELSVEQLAAAHRLADGVIFPSLLEAFSATPIEALALGTPLFAGDRDFVRSICGEAAVYFDPLDPVSAAAEIVAGFGDAVGQRRRREAGLRIAHGLSTAEQRARSYLDLITEQLPARDSGRVVAGETAWTT